MGLYNNDIIAQKKTQDAKAFVLQNNMYILNFPVLKLIRC